MRRLVLMMAIAQLTSCEPSSRHTPSTQGVGLLRVVGRQEDGLSAGGETRDLLPERAARLHVESHGWLVEEEHVRVAHDREREVETLPLPTRERGNPSVPFVTKLGRVDGFRRCDRPTIQRSEQLDDLADREHRWDTARSVRQEAALSSSE
jgi:hypothetical protein